MSKVFRTEIKLRDIKTGDHVVERQGVANKEYKPLNLAERREKEKNDETLERLNSGQADYDTGYMFVDKDDPDSAYTVKHNLGRYPTRISAFFSEVEEPVSGQDEIYWVVPRIVSDQGVAFSLPDKNTLTITVGGTKVREGFNEGYLRIMIWR